MRATQAKAHVVEVVAIGTCDAELRENAWSKFHAATRGSKSVKENCIEIIRNHKYILGGPMNKQRYRQIFQFVIHAEPEEPTP